MPFNRKLPCRRLGGYPCTFETEQHGRQFRWRLFGWEEDNAIPVSTQVHRAGACSIQPSEHLTHGNKRQPAVTEIF